MSTGTYGVPSVRQLASVVDRIAPRDTARWDGREPIPGAGGVPIRVSPARARQLWALVGMWDRASMRGELPARARERASALFTRPVLGWFWDLAEAGELRKRERDIGRPLPLASRRIVRDCLELLARVVVPGKQVWLPRLVHPAPRAVTTPRQELELFRYLVRLAAATVLPGERPGTEGLRPRLLALTSVALDTRSRTGELAAMRVADLDQDLRSVRVRRRQQNGRHLEPVEVVLPLSADTAVALRRWLGFRARVVEGLSGSADALWVTLAGSNQGHPPGLPLQPPTVTSSYARGVRTLNSHMAGIEGWEPLPDRLEGLRRAVTPMEERRVREERAAAEAALQPRGRPGRPRLPEGRAVQHGREYTYITLGCHCGECREAATNARGARRREARGL